MCVIFWVCFSLRVYVFFMSICARVCGYVCECVCAFELEYVCVSV